MAADTAQAEVASLVTRGEWLLATGEWREAQEDFQAALSVSPDPSAGPPRLDRGTPAHRHAGLARSAPRAPAQASPAAPRALARTQAARAPRGRAARGGRGGLGLAPAPRGGAGGRGGLTPRARPRAQAGSARQGRSAPARAARPSAPRRRGPERTRGAVEPSRAAGQDVRGAGGAPPGDARRAGASRGVAGPLRADGRAGLHGRGRVGAGAGGHRHRGRAEPRRDVAAAGALHRGAPPGSQAGQDLRGAGGCHARAADGRRADRRRCPTRSRSARRDSRAGLGGLRAAHRSARVRHRAALRAPGAQDRRLWRAVSGDPRRDRRRREPARGRRERPHAHGPGDRRRQRAALPGGGHPGPSRRRQSAHALGDRLHGGARDGRHARARPSAGAARA